MIVRDYPVALEPLSVHEGGGWLATVPDLPGCISDGETPEDALANVADAIGCWIDAAHRLGREVPSPTFVSETRPQLVETSPV